MPDLVHHADVAAGRPNKMWDEAVGRRRVRPGRCSAQRFPSISNGPGARLVGFSPMLPPVGGTAA